MRLILKWTLLVTLSSVASFVAAVLTDYATPTQIVAMVCGVVTFIVLYSRIDAWAQDRKKDLLVKSLKVGVIIKMALQLVPGIELGAGFVARSILIRIHLAGHGRDEPGFLETYLMTILVGLMLSFVVFVIAAVYWSLHSRATNALASKTRSGNREAA